MFDITPLEVAQTILFLIKGLATVGLFAGVPLIVDQIVATASGEHIIPLFLAAITWVNLRYFRVDFSTGKRPLVYRGRHRMSMTIDRAKARMQLEIDAVYDEAWFHNLVVDTRNKAFDALDREHHVVPESWTWA